MRLLAGRFVMAVIFAAAAPAHAQPPPPPPPPPIHGTLEFIGSEVPMFAAVRSAPFSADAVTTVTQTLADGTRIDRRVTAKLYRDVEGRMRREQHVLGLGALSPSGDAQPIVTISDPVTGVSYVLETGTRTARRGRLRPIDPGPALPPPPPPGVRPARTPVGVPNWPEPMGTRQIEGLSVTGTRRTETIPTGRVGNDRSIVVTDERWESPELKMVIVSEHHDPRTGNVEYRLTNISRDEPPQHLFTVPSDYQIVDVPPPPPPAPRPPPQ